MPLGHRGLLIPRNQQVKKEVTLPAGVTHPDYQEDYQEEIGQQLHNGDKEFIQSGIEEINASLSMTMLCY